MQARKDMIGVVCEALNRLFSTNHDQLISQVDAQCLFQPWFSDILEDCYCICSHLAYFRSPQSIMVAEYETLCHCKWGMSKLVLCRLLSSSGMWQCHLVSGSCVLEDHSAFILKDEAVSRLLWWYSFVSVGCKRAWRQIFKPKSKKVRGGCRKIYNGKLHSLYPSCNIARIIRLKCVWILVGKGLLKDLGVDGMGGQ